jgi:hypothetical protein
MITTLATKDPADVASELGDVNAWQDAINLLTGDWAEAPTPTTAVGREWRLHAADHLCTAQRAKQVADGLIGE